ncbi:MAG: alkaline phosphatase family protein [Proteobacteria bacterium]|nr:alkaline phosphatase family protein [Pseudomonadota bacterium]
MIKTVRIVAAAAISAALAASCATTPASAPHNAVIFVADGLRYGSVNETDAPELFAARRDGVDFANSHSVYPTLTTVNASAIATGHFPGDTGNFANYIYANEPALPHAGGSRIAAIEDDNILADLDARFGGNYLREQTLMSAALAHGYNVVSIGKTGPTGVQVRGIINGAAIFLDENVGEPGGPSLSPQLTAAFAAAHIDPRAPDRALPNRVQQNWFSAVATQIVLPLLRRNGRPFLLLYWSPDPDSSQHGQHDSPNTLTPGINGPTSRAAVANASSNLGALREALRASNLAATTDVVMIADHGFSTTSKQSSTSFAASLGYADVPAGQLPGGFLAIDLAHVLNLNLYSASGVPISLSTPQVTLHGSHGVLGVSADAPQAIVAAGGGSDLVYLTGADKLALARRIVAFLTSQDYTGAIFTADSLGSIPGALPLSAINLAGTAQTPPPDIVVSFRTGDTGCATPDMCGVDVADTSLPQGSGYHGGFGRADTHNFMAAVGPDFRGGFVDSAPVSNADIAPTIAHVLGFNLPSIGRLRGRVIAEALPQGAQPAVITDAITSAPAENGFRTILDRQTAGETRYFDSASNTGRTH